jgi:hypothetical protein
MRKTANQIAWEVLIKIAVVDPVIAEHVKRVAKRMKYQKPSKKDLDAMFPKGWEKKSPSWQTQFEKSPWLKAQNAAKASGTAGARAKSYRGRGRNVWADEAARGYRSSYGRGWKSWAPRAATYALRHPLLTFIAATTPGWAYSKSSKDIASMNRKRKHITPEEKAHMMEPVLTRAAPGALAGALLGASIPIVANVPTFKQHGVFKVLRHSPALLGLTAAITAAQGAAAGTGLGMLSGLSESKKRMHELQKKLDERKLKAKAFPKAAGLLK